MVFSCASDGTIGTTPYCTSWLAGNGATSQFSQTSSLLVDVTEVTVSGTNVVVTTSGIPSYAHTVTSDDMTFLNGRPNKLTDFTGGATSVSVGDVVQFGGDIGYTGGQGCANEGIGYWPKGPACPGDQAKSWVVKTDPQPARCPCTVATMRAVELWRIVCSRHKS